MSVMVPAAGKLPKKLLASAKDVFVPAANWSSICPSGEAMKLADEGIFPEAVDWVSDLPGSFTLLPISS